MRWVCDRTVLALFLLFLVLAPDAARATTPAADPGVDFPALIASLKDPKREIQRELVSGALSYRVRIHSSAVASWMRPKYTPAELRALQKDLEGTLALRADSRGLVKASDRLEAASGVQLHPPGEDPTHYDAIWVRDSLWVYLGLRTDPRGKKTAARLLTTLSDYFASPAQLARMRAVIQRPGLLSGPDGAMSAPHIRFDGGSPDFEDVQEGGRPQRWNHKQNDALGLFIDIYCRAILHQRITERELTPARAKALATLTRYLAAVRFQEMEDAGSWEEIERVNTSSIALVTSGLERLREVYQSHSTGVQALAKRIQAAGAPTPEKLGALIDSGYERIFRQLKAGGESPLYPRADPRFRQADAALLNLIYPARLARLSRSDYDRILSIVDPLVGVVGIRRYFHDSYQSGNFWYNDWPGKTTDSSSSKAFKERGNQFLPGSEAQWFFDSWYSTAAGILYQRYSDGRYRDLEDKFFNRALAQITGGVPGKPVLAADGKPVRPMALPESYNTVVASKGGPSYFAPSPITPLNWSKASLRLALRQLMKVTR